MIVRIGPIQMDPDTKYTVQSVLYSGIVNIPVKIGRDLESANMIISPQNIIIRQSSSPQHDCLKILNHLNEIKILYSEKKGPLSEKSFKLCFPKRSVLQNNSILPCIQLDNFLELQAESRHFRDYTFIVLRSLAAKQTFIDEKIIQNINIDPKTYIKDFNQFTEAILKYIHYSQIQTHYQFQLKRLKQENKCLQGEVESMEEECHLIIQTFKQILQQQGVSCGEEIEYQTRKDYRMSRRDIQEENIALKERIQQLEEELQFLQNFHTSSNNNNRSSSRFKGSTSSHLSQSGNDELISQKESDSIIKQVEKKYQQKLQKAFMELEEVRDDLNAKIQEQLLIINNLENKNQDLKNQIQILEKSNNYFSVERKSIAHHSVSNTNNNLMNREFDILKKQIQSLQFDMNQRQAKNEDFLQLQIQNQQLQNEIYRMKQNNNYQNNNENNTTLTTTRARIFDNNTPVRSRNNTIHNEEQNSQQYNQTRTIRSSSYNNIPSQRNATSSSLSRPNLQIQEPYNQTNNYTAISNRQRIPSVNNSYNFVNESQDQFTRVQQIKSNHIQGENSHKTLKYVNTNNKENLSLGGNGQLNQQELNSNYSNYSRQKDSQQQQLNKPFFNNTKERPTQTYKTEIPIVREAQILRENAQQNNNNNNNNIIQINKNQRCNNKTYNTQTTINTNYQPTNLRYTNY